MALVCVAGATLTCRSPGDCNNRCHGCNCVARRCSCVWPWSGDLCERRAADPTPSPTTLPPTPRQRGTCKADRDCNSLKCSSCHCLPGGFKRCMCDAGYTGEFCERPPPATTHPPASTRHLRKVARTKERRYGRPDMCRFDHECQEKCVVCTCNKLKRPYACFCPSDSGYSGMFCGSVVPTPSPNALPIDKEEAQVEDLLSKVEAGQAIAPAGHLFAPAKRHSTTGHFPARRTHIAILNPHIPPPLPFFSLLLLHLSPL